MAADHHLLVEGRDPVRPAGPLVRVSHYQSLCINTLTRLYVPVADAAVCAFTYSQMALHCHDMKIQWNSTYLEHFLHVNAHVLNIEAVKGVKWNFCHRLNNR